MSLKGKTLFITGASRGIGLEVALRAAADGANIAIAAKTAEPHPKLPGTIYTAAEEIEAAGGKALPLICDIRFEDQVEAALSQQATLLYEHVQLLSLRPGLRLTVNIEETRIEHDFDAATMRWQGGRIADPEDDFALEYVVK